MPLTMSTGDVKTGSGTLPRVNLLPIEIAQAARFRRIKFGLGSVVAAALGLVALLVAGAAGSVTDAHDKVDTAAAQQRSLQSQAAQYRDVTATIARAANAQALLVTAMGEEVRYSRFLDGLAQTIPDHVWIKSVTFSQAVPAGAAPAAGATIAGIGSVTFAGTAYQHEDVAVLLESLKTQKGYGGPLFQNSTEGLIGTRTVVTFSVTVALTPEALSGRYLTVGS